jgi:hypothetical protein
VCDTREDAGIGRRALTVWYVMLGLGSALVWSRIADIRTLPSWHLDMLAGAAPAPNQYRPLTPWLAELLRQALPGHDLIASYVLLRAAITGATLIVFDRYMRVWYEGAAAIAGTLALATLLPLTYLPVVQESDPLNLLAFVYVFLALARRYDAALLPLVLVGTLNRETVALVPALYAIVRWRDVRITRLVMVAGLLGATWVVVYGCLVGWYGLRGYYCDVVMLRHNVSSWMPTMEVLLLYGPLWLLAAVAAPTAPIVLRRSVLLLPPYLALHYLVASVDEPRLFLPFAPVVIPLAWRVLFRASVVPDAAGTDPVSRTRRSSSQAPVMHP